MAIWKTMTVMAAALALAGGSFVALADDRDSYIYNGQPPGCSAAGAPSPADACPPGNGGGDACPNALPQEFHTYVVGTTARAHVEDTGGIAAGGFSVFDTNTADCNGDGIPFDSDGDPDAGIGGGFLPQGVSTEACGFKPHHEGDTFAVSDFAFSEVYFVVAGNDVDRASPDVCGGDGLVTPDVDAGDWFEVCESQCTLPGTFVNTNACLACAVPEVGGADGGVYVFVDPTFEAEDGSAEAHGASTGIIFQFQSP